MSISQIFLVFDGVLLRYFVGCPSVAVCLSFSHASTGVMGFERKTMEVNEVVLITSSQGCAMCSVAQWFPTLCSPMDCSPPNSSVHGDSPGKNTGVGCHTFSRDFPTQVSHIAGEFFTFWATREDHEKKTLSTKYSSDMLYELLYLILFYSNIL